MNCPTSRVLLLSESLLQGWGSKAVRTGVWEGELKALLLAMGLSEANPELSGLSQAQGFSPRLPRESALRSRSFVLLNS